MENSRTSGSGSRNASGNFNPSMSRGGFIKTVGVGAAALSVSAARGQEAKPPPGTRPTTKTIYPMGHGMFIDALSPAAPGQTQFDLSKTGPFTRADALVNGLPLRLLSDTFTITSHGGIWKLAWDGKVKASMQGPPLQFADADGNPQPAPLFLTSDGDMRHIRIYKDGGNFANDVHFSVSEDGKSIIPTWPRGFDWTKYAWTIDYQAVLQPTDILRVLMYFAPEEFTASAGQKTFALANGSKNAGYISVLLKSSLPGSTYQQKPASAYIINGNTLTFHGNLNAGDKVCVSYSDADTLLKALEGTTKNDTIYARRVALDGATSKPWNLGKLRLPGEQYLQTNPIGITTDGYGITSSNVKVTGTYVFFDFSSGASLAGELVNNQPATVMHQFGTEAEWREYWLVTRKFPGWEDPLVVFSASSANYPTVSNIVFQYITYPCNSGAPHAIRKCRFDFIGEVFNAIDNRWTFPHLMDAPYPYSRNFDGMIETVIEDCEFTNVWWMPIQGSGSGYVIRNCRFHDCPQLSSSIGGIVGLGAIPWAANWGLTDQDIFLRYANYNRMENCVFDCSTMGDMYRGASISLAVDDPNFESIGCSYSNNTFTDYQGWFCLEAGYCNGGATSYGHKAEGNTFIRCDCPILCDGSWDGTILSDCLIANNNIIDHDQAPKSPTFWTTPIWWWNNDQGPSGSPGIWIDSAENVSLVNNNFTQSGILPDQAWYLSAIWLDLCSNCSINQPNSTFPQDLSVEHWVVDTNGSGNTLNGGAFASAGASQAGASSSEVRTKMHDKMMRRNLQRHKRP